MSDAEEILFLEHKRANLSADEIAMGIQKEHVVFNAVWMSPLWLSGLQDSDRAAGSAAWPDVSGSSGRR
jgi:hypothetical protein